MVIFFFQVEDCASKFCTVSYCCVDVIPGAAAEFKPGDIPVETVLSEEGHQVGIQ